MKKTFYLILIVCMLFAFVACNPETNNESLLSGEVTPPAESKRVEASDEEIDTFISVMNNGTAGSAAKTMSISSKMDLTFENGDTFSLSMEEESKNGEIGSLACSSLDANGVLTIGNDKYTIKNYVLSYSDNGELNEDGTVLKNDKEMSKDEAKTFLYDFRNGYRYKYDVDYSSIKVEETYSYTTEKGKTTYVMVLDNDDWTYVYDVTYGEDRAQCKMSVTATGESFEYIALNGRFFNENSIAKVEEKLFSQYN